MLVKNFSATKKPRKRRGRIPPSCNGVQVNHCKEPTCPNFGVAADPDPPSRGRYADPARQDVYKVGRKKGNPKLICKECGSEIVMKSNVGIYEEYERSSAYLAPQVVCCPDPKCKNHKKPLGSAKGLYKSKGLTPSKVAKRYECCKCGKTFSVRFVAIAQQRRSNINLMFMRCLCNKSPLKGLSAIFDLGSKSVYDKIDFIYERCMEFAASRERKLLEGMKLPKLYLSTDRQIYLVNWITRECRRNVQMYLTATADNKSRYVFAADLNYDPSVEAADIEKDAEKVGDYRTDPPFRKHARLWLLKDFLKDNTPDQPEPIPKIAKLNWDDPEEREILAAYLQATNRNKDKPTDRPDLDLHQLPWTGMSVHNEYTMYGHYLLVKRLVCGAPKIRISMDRDSGMEPAVLAAFRDEIIDRRCDAFLVKIDRESKIDDRRYGFFRGKYLLQKYMKEHPDKTRREAQDEILKERVANRRWLDDDFWFTNPFPTVAEPEMEAAYITEVERLGEKHLSRLFGTVSLLGVNIFFANLRRKQSMLERPISTPSAAGRKWYGYSAYNPRILTKIVAIHRVWFNYARRNLKQKITPAMRLGLAEKPIEPHRILYGLPLAEGRTKTFYYWERKERNETLPDYGNEPDPLAPKPEVPDWDEGTIPVIGGGTTPCFEDPTPTVYLDTETTGKFLTDEIIEIAIIDDDGNILLDTLVHTKHPISLGAFRTHGILKKMLKKKPTLAKIEEQIVRHITGKHLVIFNAPFDYRYLTDAIKKAPARISCCQREHSQYHGKKHNEPEPYDRHSLQFACKEIGYA